MGKREMVQKLSEKMGGSPVRDENLAGFKNKMPAFDVELDGRKLTLGIWFANKMLLCVIQVRRDPLPLIVFRREKWNDRLGRRLFLNQEVQSGDDAFDEQVYIETDEREDLVKRVVEKPEARAAILGAVAQHRAIILSREGVSGTVLFTTDPDRTLAAIKVALLPLGAIADALPKVQGVGVRMTARGDWLAVAMLIGIPFAVLGNALVPHFKPDRWEPYLTRQQKPVESAAMWAFVLFIVLAFVWIRGHSRSLRNFAWTLFSGVFVVPFSILQLCYMGNALLDHSAPTTHESTVVGKRERSTRYNHYYNLTFNSIFHPGQTADLDIEWGLWKDLKKGDPIQVSLREGRFGWMWADSVRKP